MISVRSRLKNFALLSRMNLDERTLQEMFDILMEKPDYSELPSPTPEERLLVHDGERIRAIKSLRDRTKMNLVQAKNIVEHWMVLLKYNQ